MSRNQRDFSARSAEEREWMLNNTWCDACGEADLGMSSPQEYDEDGHVYVEGHCRKCGQAVRSEITEKGTS